MQQNEVGPYLTLYTVKLKMDQRLNMRAKIKTIREDIGIDLYDLR